MAGRVVANRLDSPFDFEIVDGDPDLVTSVVASSNQISPWIDPASIKLRHRIGRGPFGDVWLATLRRTAEEYEESHEVAVKILHPVKEDSISSVLARLAELFSKCNGIESVCLLQGISTISGKLCIVMKFYEGSLGDKMARLKAGKLSVNDVIRYGTDLAQGIVDLHSKDVLILNLKPCNFLLDEKDRAIIGDIGIPYLVLGIPLLSSDTNRRLGTPNYMAPEQWQPEVRGPISFETDSWGFACSIVEMLTGVQPWSGKTVDEIYKLVVKKQEKPLIPSGLPPPIVNIINGCFEYDFRSRPLMGDILQAFKSSSEEYGEKSLDGPGIGIVAERISTSGYSEWFLLKDPLEVDDTVRSRKRPNSCKPENMDVPCGTVVGDVDKNGFVLVRVHGIHDPVRVHSSTLERVSFGLASGDWVRLNKAENTHSPVGILHHIHRDGSVAVGFIGLETLWRGNCADLQMAETYCVGQFVRLKSDIYSPRFEWPRKRGGQWATGRISQISPNGCLTVKFPGRLTFGDENSSFLADPAEVELISFNTSPGMIKKYQHFEDLHWVVRPLLIALGLFSAMKLGQLVGKKIGRPKLKISKSVTPVDHSLHEDGENAGNSTWLPPKVANIIFREGVGTTTSR